jgi:hypothetical protein
MIELAAEISGSESVLAGLDTLIAPQQQRLDVVITELRHLREEQAREAERAEIRGIGEAGLAALGQMPDLHPLIAKFEEERVKLRKIVATGFLRLPIPPRAAAANAELITLDKAFADKIALVLKLLGR